MENLQVYVSNSSYTINKAKTYIYLKLLNILFCHIVYFIASIYGAKVSVVIDQFLFVESEYSPCVQEYIMVYVEFGQ